MGLFGLFDNKSSSSSSSTTSQTTQDQRVATDNASIGQSGSGNVVNNQFTDNVLSAFRDLTTLTAGSLELVNETVMANARNAADSLQAVTGSASQVGAENSTLQKIFPYIVMLGGVVAVAMLFKGK